MKSQTLTKILENIDGQIAVQKFHNSYLNLKKIPKTTLNLLEEVFEDLDFIGNVPEEIIWKWFFETETHIFQFDEQSSFNRYRNITLRSDLYDSFKGFNKEKYRRFCRQKETECLKSARTPRLWSNSLSKIWFGEGDEVGQLNRKGAPLWKLNALLEFCQDLSCEINHKKLIRLSIYDEYLVDGQIQTLGKLLSAPSERETEIITKNIQHRIKSVMN